jgi:hypothetical protein
MHQGDVDWVDWHKKGQGVPAPMLGWLGFYRELKCRLVAHFGRLDERFLLLLLRRFFLCASERVNGSRAEDDYRQG